MTPDYITDLVRSCSHRVICADFHKNTPISWEHIISVVDQFIADYKPANNLSTVRRNRVVGELFHQLMDTVLYNRTPSTNPVPSLSRASLSY